MIQSLIAVLSLLLAAASEKTSRKPPGRKPLDPVEYRHRTVSGDEVWMVRVVYVDLAEVYEAGKLPDYEAMRDFVEQNFSVTHIDAAPELRESTELWISLPSPPFFQKRGAFRKLVQRWPEFVDPELASLAGSRPMTDQEKTWLEVGVNDPEVAVEDCDWIFVPRYWVEKLVPLLRNVPSWEEWVEAESRDFGEERVPGRAPGYMAAMREWVTQDPSAVDPIQVVEDVDGNPLGIWDGWHRTGTAIVSGQPWLPAFVGRVRPGVGRRP